MKHSIMAMLVVLAVPFSQAEIKGKSEKVEEDIRVKTTGPESMIWNVGKNIQAFRIDVRSGTAVIQTAKVLGGEEVRIGRVMNKGQSFEHIFKGPTNVNQFRINVDRGEVDSRIRLVIFPTDGFRVGQVPGQDGGAPGGDPSIARPTIDKGPVVWEIHEPRVEEIELVVRSGKLIINTVRLGATTPEITVGKWFQDGQRWTHEFDKPVPVAKLQFNVDKARGSEIQLLINGHRARPKGVENATTGGGGGNRGGVAPPAGGGQGRQGKGDRNKLNLNLQDLFK